MSLVEQFRDELLSSIRANEDLVAGCYGLLNLPISDKPKNKIKKALKYLDTLLVNERNAVLAIDELVKLKYPNPSYPLVQKDIFMEIKSEISNLIHSIDKLVIPITGLSIVGPEVKNV
jgi:hypothetical protein